MTIQDRPDWSDPVLAQGLPGQWALGPNDGLFGGCPALTETQVLPAAGSPVYIFGIDVWVPPGGGATATEWTLYSGSSPYIAGGYLAVGAMVSVVCEGWKNTNEGPINIYSTGGPLKYVVRFG